MNDKGYTNPQLLISAEELMNRLDDGSICLVDVRPTHEYVEGHIPGAIHLDLFAISLSDTSEQVFDAFMWTIAYLFKDRGIDPTKTIVWYENESGVKAARGFWFCEYLGHEDVRVLDGGLGAWSAAGGEVSYRTRSTRGGATILHRLKNQMPTWMRRPSTGYLMPVTLLFSTHALLPNITEMSHAPHAAVLSPAPSISNG